MAAETAVEEAEETEEAALETPMEAEPMAEEANISETLTAGNAVQDTQPAPKPPSQASQRSESQNPAASPDSDPSNAKTEAAPQAGGGSKEAVEESLPTEAASEDRSDLAVTTEEEAAPEAAEPDDLPGETGGGSNETIIDTQPSSALTWQQARDRLCEYLGRVPEDLTAQDRSRDGESWLFTAGGVRYAVNRHSGAVTTLSAEE